MDKVLLRACSCSVLALFLLLVCAKHTSAEVYRCLDNKGVEKMSYSRCEKFGYRTIGTLLPDGTPSVDTHTEADADNSPKSENRAEQREQKSCYELGYLFGSMQIKRDAIPSRCRSNIIGFVNNFTKGQSIGLDKLMGRNGSAASDKNEVDVIDFTKVTKVEFTDCCKQRCEGMVGLGQSYWTKCYETCLQKECRSPF